VSIGNLENEGDLERFIDGVVAQRLTLLSASHADLVASTAGSQQETVATAEGDSGSGTYVDLATVGPQFEITDAGVYSVTGDAQFTAASAVTPYLGLFVNGVQTREWRATLGTGSGIGQIHGTDKLSLAKGDVLLLRYHSQGAIAVTWSNRSLVARRLS